MGANSTKIAISETIQYYGQVQDGVPHGKGTISIFSKDSQKKQKTKIEGKFVKGKILQGRVNQNNVIYEGPISNQKLTGIGKLTFGQTAFNGQIVNGIAKAGEMSKQNQYTCKGGYMELDVSEKVSSSTDQCEGMKTLILEGKSSFGWIQKKQNLEGQFKNGQLNGKGVYKFSNGDVYQGQFKNGQICGYGVYESKNSQLKKVLSTFDKSKPHCKRENEGDRIAKVEFKNGDCYQGSLLNGSMHGSSGKYTYSNGTIYQGEFYHNTMTGDCQIKFQPGFQIENYKGEVSEGLFNGLGVVEYRNGIILKGYFLKNKKNGPCIIIYGNRMFKCLFVMDELVGALTEVPTN